MRRVLRILATALITAGGVLFVDVAVTLAWKEPVSALYASLLQGQARAELDDLERSLADSGVLTAAAGDESERAAELADALSSRLETGKAIGELRAPAMGVDQVIIAGTDTDSLKRGPGHYPTTGLPGAGTTVAIAGHRTTYGAPFRDIDAIEVGDGIEVEMPYGTFSYEVTKTRIVEPTQTEIVRDTGRERLVLTACHPLYSAAKRYAVMARPAGFELAPGN